MTNFQHPKGDRKLIAAINAVPDSAITPAMRADAAATAAKVDAEAARGKWQVLLLGKGDDRVDRYAVQGREAIYGPLYHEEATDLAARLNAADELADMLDEALIALEFVQRGHLPTLGHKPDDLVPRVKAALAKFGGGK